MADPLQFDPIEEAGRQWRAHWGSAPLPAMKAVTSIMRAAQILLARLNEALAPFSLTFARYEALMLLHFTRAGSLPLGKIGARLQVHPTSVTNLVDGLEKLGYVQRTPHPSDRRTTLATITQRGREVADAASEALHEIQFGTPPLSGSELETVTDVLGRLRAAAGDFRERAQPAEAEGRSP
ncbi:MAG: MarR family transcriptional regulator [Solirubrobacteraceae bacterium]